jgi:hypothetical protein
MIERNARTTAAVRSDYDNNSNHYDRERLGRVEGDTLTLKNANLCEARSRGHRS